MRNGYGIGYDSKENEFYFDLDDYNVIKDIYWSKNQNGYFRGCSNGKEIALHRIIMGVEDEKLYVDHINHERADNRKNNLRIVTPKKICRDNLTETELKDAYKIVGNWRAAHAYPLYVITKKLRSLCGNNSMVVHRLKRMDSIVGKLKRFEQMSLYGMQDLGG